MGVEQPSVGWCTPWEHREEKTWQAIWLQSGGTQQEGVGILLFRPMPWCDIKPIVWEKKKVKQKDFIRRS